MHVNEPIISRRRIIDISAEIIQRAICNCTGSARGLAAAAAAGASADALGSHLKT